MRVLSSHTIHTITIHSEKEKLHHANSKSIRTREVRATTALYIDSVALENKEATPRGITKSDGGIMEGQMRRYSVAFRKPVPAVL